MREDESLSVRVTRVGTLSRKAGIGREREREKERDKERVRASEREELTELLCMRILMFRASTSLLGLRSREGDLQTFRILEQPADPP